MDVGNAVVLAVAALSIAALIAGYVVAWRSKNVVARKFGSWTVAAVSGLAGLVMTTWLIGAVLPFPPPDGSSVWGPLLAILLFSPIPIGAFYLSAKFARRVGSIGR